MRVKIVILTVLIGGLLINVTPIHARLHSNSSDSAYEGGDGTSSTGEATLACCSVSFRQVCRGLLKNFFEKLAPLRLESISRI